MTLNTTWWQTMAAILVDRCGGRAVITEDDLLDAQRQRVQVTRRDEEVILESVPSESVHSAGR